MTTNFNFSFGDLIQRADRIDTLLQRDAEQFSGIGYNGDFRTSLKEKTTVFRALPSDDYWQGQQMLKTEDKKRLLSELTAQLVDLRFRAKLALGERSVEYRSLRFTKLKNIKEQDLIIYAEHVTKTCREMLAKLAPRNVTEEMLATIDTTAQQLDTAIDEQKKMISVREAKAFEREEKANEIYSLISEACEVGKRIWEDVNQAHYHDYVIYGSKEKIEDEEEVVEEDTEAAE
ncbi:MAG: hypothetical protein AB7U05_04505 [Mangrovibacterium sp.]